MVQKLISRLYSFLGIDGPMTSHRRTTSAERNAIQINMMAQRFTEMGKTFLYGGSVAALTMHLLDKQLELWAGLLTMGIGLALFCFGLACTGWYVENKQEPSRVIVQNVRMKRKRRNKR